MITGSGNRNNTSTKSGMTQDTRYVLAEDESLVTTTTKPLHILSMAGGWTSYKVSIKTVVTESVGNTSNSRSSSQHVSAIASVKTVSHTSDRNNRYMTSPQFSVIIIIIMYIYHALINALSAHMIHINLNMIFYTHLKHSPTKTIYIKYYLKNQ